MMKILKIVLVAGIIFVGATASSLAGEIKRELDFRQDYLINGQVVKKGTYQVVFNDKTNEITFLKRKQEVAKTKVTLEELKKKARRNEIVHREVGGNAVLQEVTFGGEKQSFILNNTGVAAAPNQ